MGWLFVVLVYCFAFVSHSLFLSLSFSLPHSHCLSLSLLPPHFVKLLPLQRPHGTGTYVNQDGTVYEGTFLEGKYVQSLTYLTFLSTSTCL